MCENVISLRVWGDFACFTRPEMKVERVSYPIMTPSAARGILEAIFWEPQMYYLIDSVSVVKRGSWVSFRRNEVIDVISLDNVQTWMKAPGRFKPIQAGGGAPDGSQRNMLALGDVEYVITAEVRLSELGRTSGQTLSKYAEEIERRARQGKCFHRPALGVREFAANFEWTSDPASIPLADWWEEDLGLMLYDVFEPGLRDKGFHWLTSEELAQAEHAPEARGRRKVAVQGARRYEGAFIRPRACFFHAWVQRARMDCHPERVKILSQTKEEGV